MKKIYLITLLIITTLWSAAQTFEVRIADTDTIVANNDTLFAAGTSDQFDINKYFEIENVTADEIIVHVLRENVDLPEGMEAVFCLNVCYASTTTEADATIAGGAIQNFDADLWPHNNGGTALVKYTLSNEAESEELALFVEYDVEPLGITSNLSNKISVYPNPVNDILNVNFSGQNSQLQVFDAVGKLIKETNLQTNGNYQVDFSKMVSGIYLVRLMDDGQIVQTQKVMKY